MPIRRAVACSGHSTRFLRWPWHEQALARRMLLSFAAIHSATLGDKIFDDPIGAAALMHDITPHFWCRLAQADVFCARNTDVFQMLRQRCDPYTARRQGNGARSYGDLLDNLRTEPGAMA